MTVQPLSRASVPPFMQKLRPADHISRAAAGTVRAVFDPRDRTPFDVAKEMFPGDQPTTQILRAATSPATTTGTGWASDHATQKV